MYRAGQLSPPSSPLPPSRQNKAMLQKEYRKQEGECFNLLRDVIGDLIGEELRTRQEILRKAIDLLSSFSVTGNQCETQASTLTPFEIPAPIGPGDGTLAHLSYSVQSPHWPQTWQPNAEFDAATPYYGTYFHDEQYWDFMSAVDLTLNQPSSPGYGEDSPNQLQFRRVF